MTKNYFDNYKIRSSLKLWLDKEYEIISSLSDLSEMFKNEYLKIAKQLIDKKNKEKFLEDDFFNKSIYIVHSFANNPWITQIEILEILNISIEELNSLNLILRNSEIFQHIILKEGIGNKYWNSIIPFAKNANLVLDKKISLPKRIVIFPGVSCMFFCGFCGRNQSAKYPMKSVGNGTSVFNKLFNETGNNTLYSIGGGLEPTTNPELGEIINSAIKNQIRMPLITNGYSLTENYVKKNPGIWNLDSLRLSLYGVDDESYYFITRLKKSYSMVMKNSINFLKLRNEKNPNLKFGLNFIVIPENIDQVLKILDVVREINQNVTNGRGVDFITLRDDFQAVTGHTIEKEEAKKYTLNSTMDEKLRKKLFGILGEFKSIKEKEFPDLHVDYGYSIFAVSRGVTTQGLKMITTDKLPDFGYPQLSLAIDLYGDVFLYREAGFLERYGNKKFIIGRLDSTNTLEEVIKEFLDSGNSIKYDTKDTKFMDSFDHVLASIVNQAKKDKEIEIPFDKGPVQARSNLTSLNLGNNWYTDELV
jgi:dTDP-4-amino-4,6-dideoxy-D-glucose ammonia-lyase